MRRGVPSWLLFGFAVTLCVALGPSCIPTPKPGKRECWNKSPNGCATCVAEYCGWCENGCFSLYEGSICVDPVTFPTDCKDGTAPFPDPVVNPIPYHLKRRDGGPVDRRDAGPDRPLPVPPT